jgi:hypothetical protein
MDLRETGVGRCGLDASGSGKGLVVGSSKQSKEPSGSIKGKELLD